MGWWMVVMALYSICLSWICFRISEVFQKWLKINWAAEKLRKIKQIEESISTLKKMALHEFNYSKKARCVFWSAESHRYKAIQKKLRTSYQMAAPEYSITTQWTREYQTWVGHSHRCIAGRPQFSDEKNRKKAMFNEISTLAL